jgi:DNA mismatch endonuclease (patch repair protein)
MSRIRSTNTKPELAVRRAAFARGLRYRVNCSALPGRPDLVFACSKVAVFVDGDFWHGRQWQKWLHKLPSEYWKQKITRNRLRDAANSRMLKRAGWLVIRVWEHQVKNALEQSIDRIEESVRSRSPGAAQRRGPRQLSP